MSKQIARSDFTVSASDHLTDALQFLSQVPSYNNGTTGWESSKLNKGTFEIVYSLKFKPEIDDHIKDGAIWHALNECARNKDFSNKYFIQRIKSYLRENSKKPSQSLVGIAQINCTWNSGLPKTMLSCDGKLQFMNYLSTGDSTALAKTEPYEREKLGLHEDFFYVVTRASAADHRSAIDRAERNIKYGLGVLNLVHHGYGISKRIGLPNAPLGRFLTATPVFLVDRKTRKLGYYYSDNYYPDRYKASFSVWNKIDEDGERIAAHYTNDLKNIDFRDKIVQAVILFQEGLESIGIDLALLKFWTGIELICSKHEKESTERVIERASSIFINPKYVKMRLNFIQAFRNKIVHKGISGEHAVLCAQWGSILLAELIRFCLFNPHKIKTHEEILDYMSLPIDPSSINKTISLSKKRLKMLKNKEL